MKTRRALVRGWSWLLVVLLATPPNLLAQQAGAPAAFKPEELDQVLAPIALYPDSLVSQILMASTYPLEIVTADRFAKQNKNLKGDALTKALEAQTWDPSVKSLVNFPQVLAMMSEKLDWTQKLGDAFLADQKAVLNTIQSLRAKAQAAGNLKTTKEQTVIVEEKIIKIESASPQVVYVPTYNPAVVYGAWPYPAYPPYYYHPPGYVASSTLWFGAGVAMGAAWGYAWGNTNWHGGDVDIDVNRNTNINNNINRTNIQNRPASGQGKWQHNPENRKGVAYRDQGTAQKFNRASSSDAVKSREDFRGRAEAGQRDLARGDAGDRGGIGDRGGAAKGGAGDRGGASQISDRGGSGSRGGADRGSSGNRGGAFSGVDRGGSSAKASSQRGSASRASSGGGGRSGGGGGGRSGGGGGGRGGGGRR